MNHAAYIIAAYAAGLLTVAGLIAWVMLDYSAQLRILRDLDRRGVKRRSQKK